MEHSVTMIENNAQCFDFIEYCGGGKTIYFCNLTKIFVNFIKAASLVVARATVDHEVVSSILGPGIEMWVYTSALPSGAIISCRR